MKSLKRTLCLVLALVMVLGMFGIASATSFTDDSSIQYKEAVDVMTGIGAINGMGDGTFAPKGTITRAQAATMVARAVLSADVAATLAGSTSSFSDVNSYYSWAIPSIEYLVKVGAIAGRGDGTFDPEGKVTAYEIGKMLLVCLGIDGEYTGNSWTIDTAINAQKAGLYAGRASGANALGEAASREECALYCFNALLSTTEKYTATETWYLVSAVPTSSVSLPGVVGEMYSSVANAVAAATAAAVTYDNATPPVATPATATLGVDYTLTPVSLSVTKYTGSIASSVYPTLKDTTVAADDLGRPATVWKYKNATISKASIAPVVTYTGRFTSAALYSALGLSASATTSITATVNGKTATPGTASITATAGDTSTAYGGTGVTTEFYAVYDSGGTLTGYKAVQIAYYLDTVTYYSVGATASKGAYTNYYINGVGPYTAYSSVVNAVNDVSKAFVTGNVSSGSPVLYYFGNGTLYIEPVTTVTGVLTSVSSSNVLTIDGSTYSLAFGAAAPTPSAAAQTFYVGSNGYVYGATGVTQSSNYGLMLGTTTTYTYDATTGVMTPSYNMLIAATDGAVAKVPVKNASALTAADALVGKLVTYTVDVSVTSATYYTATQASTGTSHVSALSGFTKGTAKITNTDGSVAYANASTVFVFANVDSNGYPTGTVTTYTGISNVPSTVLSSTAGSAIYAVDTSTSVSGDTIANAVFVYNSSTASTNTYVYVKGTYTTTASAKVYDVIVGGVETTLSIPVASSLTGGKLYASISVTGNTLTAVEATAITNVTGVRTDGDMIYVTTNNLSFSLADTTYLAGSSVPVFVIYTSSNTCIPTTAGAAGTYVGATGVYIVPSATTATAAAIFVLY